MTDRPETTDAVVIGGDNAGLAAGTTRFPHAGSEDLKSFVEPDGGHAKTVVPPCSEADFRNYTYAKYGQEFLARSGAVGRQLFDSATHPLPGHV